jgi:hypothetical protein
MAALEHDVRDLAVAVDKEPVDASETMAVARRQLARSPDLDLSFGDAVVCHRDVAVIVDVRFAKAGVAVVRNGEHVLDPDVPVGIVGRELAQPEIRELLHRGHLMGVLERATKRDGGMAVVRGRGEVDRDQARESVPVVWRDDQMRDVARDRVDDDIGELAEAAVGAANRSAEFQFHDPFLSSRERGALSPSG